jgi:hypothetical protein
MKIFAENNVNTKLDSNVESKMTKSAKGAKGPTRKKNVQNVEKKLISASEIKEKLAANLELSNTAKQKLEPKNVQKLGDGFMNAEVALEKFNNLPPMSKDTKVEKSDDPNTPDHLIKSDVGTNSPADPNTTEKLKTVLSKGAFNFSSKERETLDRILADQN